MSVELQDRQILEMICVCPDRTDAHRVFTANDDDEFAVGQVGFCPI